MTSEAVSLFIAAAFLLFVAHVARTVRWALLFPAGYLLRRFNLLLGLSLGYLVNAILPWRLGEILRAFFVSQRESVRFAYVAATVIAERLADIVAVAVIVTSLSAAGLVGMGKGAVTFVLTLLAIAAVISGAVVLIRISTSVRRVIWSVASIFNSQIRFGIVDFIWSLSEMVAGGQLLRWRFLGATVVMWMLYIASYIVFGRAVGESLNDTIYALLGSPLRPVVERLADNTYHDGLALMVFTALPIVGVLGWGLVHEWSKIPRTLRAVVRYRGPPAGWWSMLARDRFKTENEYEYFLVALFSGDDQLVTQFGLQAINEGIVHKLFPGGSDAIVALVEIDEQLLIRKYAVGSASDKLKVQLDWLRAHRGSDLSLVDVIAEHEGPGFFRYDMPFVVPSNDFYDVIHTLPIEYSEALLTNLIANISTFHNQTSNGEADSQTIEAYLANKVVQNAREVLDFARTMLPDTSFEINGTSYNLDEWKRFEDMDWLSSQVRDTRTAMIHGDLTIENIIIAPNRKCGWYMIDPNPVNLFESPLIDWSKLMQSLHLGYEGLNRGAPCSLTGNSISLSFTKSHAYATLHAHLENLIGSMNSQRGDTLREVYFHELVNYLRLTPYKIRQNSRKGLTFFACTNLLLRRYLERTA